MLCRSPSKNAISLLWTRLLQDRATREVCGTGLDYLHQQHQSAGEMTVALPVPVAAEAVPVPEKEVHREKRQSLCNSDLPITLDNIPSVWSFDAKIEWLVPGFLPLAATTLLCAASGTGKTWLAYAIAAVVAAGGTFLGHQLQPRPVAYFDGENPVAIVRRNLAQLGVAETPNLRVWGGWLSTPPPGPDDPGVLEFAKKEQPLLIYDSLIHFNTGDEQQATDTREFMNHFRALTHAGAIVLVLHNSGKSNGSKKYRGSSDIEAAADMAYTIQGFPRDGALDRLSVRYFKSRFAPGVSFDLQFEAGRGFSLLDDGSRKPMEPVPALVQRILEEQSKPLNGTEIKGLCKGIAGGEAVDKYLKTLPSTRGKGKELLYATPIQGDAK
jgi:AAA domain